MFYDLCQVLIGFYILHFRSPSGEAVTEGKDGTKEAVNLENNIHEEDIDEIESFEREEQRIQEEVERQVRICFLCRVILFKSKVSASGKYMTILYCV